MFKRSSEIFVDSRGYAKDDEGNETYVGKQWAGVYRGRIPSGLLAAMRGDSGRSNPKPKFVDWSGTKREKIVWEEPKQDPTIADNLEVLKKPIETAIANANTPKATVELKQVRESLKVLIRPVRGYEGQTRIISTHGDISANSTVNIEISQTQYLGPGYDAIAKTTAKVSQLSKTVSKLIEKYSDFPVSAEVRCNEMVKTLRSTLKSSMDLEIEYVPTKDVADWFVSDHVQVKIYAPGTSRFKRDEVARFTLKPSGDDFRFDTMMPTPDEVNVQGGDKNQAQVIATARDFIKQTEKAWEKPEVQAKYLPQINKSLAIERLEQQRREEADRRNEEFLRKKRERENKTTVNSAAQEKIGILETLAAKSPKPEVKALANMIREMYESGQKPDDEQLKRIRNYLYTVGMRPQADHFRVASSKSVVQRWLRRFR